MGNPNFKKPTGKTLHFTPRWVRQLTNNRNLVGHNVNLFQIFLIQNQIKLEVKPAVFYDFCKRIFDLSFVFLALIFFAPFIFLVGVLIKLDSAGPVFFLQERAGKNFQVFKIIKFRTMTESAELEKHELLQKSLIDVRATRLGKLLRKWKIDELPQICNIILGQMSLVGPRPFTLEESVFVDQSYIKRFGVLPGLTGLWQATKPNTISAFEKFRLDAEYVDKRSFLFDLFLILKTIPRVMKGEADKKSHKHLAANESDRAA